MTKYNKNSSVIAILAGFLALALSFQASAAVPLTEDEKKILVGEIEPTPASYTSFYSLPVVAAIAAGTLIPVAFIYGYTKARNGRYRLGNRLADGAIGQYDTGLIQYLFAKLFR